MIMNPSAAIDHAARMLGWTVDVPRHSAHTLILTRPGAWVHVRLFVSGEVAWAGVNDREIPATTASVIRALRLTVPGSTVKAYVR